MIDEIVQYVMIVGVAGVSSRHYNLFGIGLIETHNSRNVLARFKTPFSFEHKNPLEPCFCLGGTLNLILRSE